MILRLALEILEYTLLPVLFHEVPVADETMSDRILHRVAGGRVRLVAYVKVQVVEAARQFNANSFFHRYGYTKKPFYNILLLIY